LAGAQKTEKGGEEVVRRKEITDTITRSTRKSELGLDQKATRKDSSSSSKYASSTRCHTAESING
jgi:hypothetical protein